LVNTQMTNVVARQKLYVHGGILSITPQILIVDLLSGVLEPKNITGMVVLHAERVVATAVEAFILRIYRQFNKDGFLKAFSDAPEAFTSGFSPLAKMMRNLFLCTPILYPRFHLDVVRSLEARRKAEVIELEVPMTEGMASIQAAIMECVEAAIGDLKKGNSGLDMSDWNLDNALQGNFDQIVMRQLNPVWHRLHPRTKQVAADLRLLRTMLHDLLALDCVKFNQYLDTIVAASQPRPGQMKQNQSPWLFLDAAQTIFETARNRVYAGKMSDNLPLESKAAQEAMRPVLEELPKWIVLSEILDEIERDVHFNPVLDDSSGAILIMCGSRGTCAQLREYLQHRQFQEPREDENEAEEPYYSADSMMKTKLRNYFYWKRSFARLNASLYSEMQQSVEARAEAHSSGRTRGPPNKRRRVRGNAKAAAGLDRSDSTRVTGDKEGHLASLLDDVEITSGAVDAIDDMAVDSLEGSDEFLELFEMRDLIVIHPYDGDIDEHVLEEVRPRYVIMYEPDTAFTRRVEVYRSSHTDRNVRVYFMYYKNSVEEQRYLASVRREKDAFTKLIRERGVSGPRTR
jgi:DNA excision repair protein ERCC-4